VDRTTVAPMTGPGEGHGPLLGNGGMEVIGLSEPTSRDYGADGEDLGWVAGSWTPTALACNPTGRPRPGSIL